jgi:hypothetical protein
VAGWDSRKGRRPICVLGCAEFQSPYHRAGKRKVELKRSNNKRCNRSYLGLCSRIRRKILQYVHASHICEENAPKSAHEIGKRHSKHNSNIGAKLQVIVQGQKIDLFVTNRPLWRYTIYSVSSITREHYQNRQALQIHAQL